MMMVVVALAMVVVVVVVVVNSSHNKTCILNLSVNVLNKGHYFYEDPLSIGLAVEIKPVTTCFAVKCLSTN